MRDIVSPLDGFLSPFGMLRGSAAFTPASLFANDETGIWLDPSDLSTLFTDTTGATPVTTPGQTVALALDKSQGLTLGPELVTNGGFDTDSDWTKGTGWTISGGQAVHAAGTATLLSQTIALTTGRAYVATCDVVAVSGGSGSLQFRSGGTTTGVTISDSDVGKTVQVFYVAEGNSQVAAYAGSGTALTVDNIFVKLLSGNHTTQSGSSFRPQYQTAGLLFDSLDDRMNTPYKPTTSGTIIAKFNGDTASRVIAGSQSASDGRCFLALDASGRLAAGIGAQSTATIYGGSDIRGEDHVGAVTWDGSTVKLHLDGTEVYSEAQSGAVNTTVDMMLGALSANGTAAAFWDGTIADHIILDRVMTPTEITNLTNLWSD